MRQHAQTGLINGQRLQELSSNDTDDKLEFISLML
jgi:hypothetical protein